MSDIHSPGNFFPSAPMRPSMDNVATMLPVLDQPSEAAMQNTAPMLTMPMSDYQQDIEMRPPMMTSGSSWSNNYQMSPQNTMGYPFNYEVQSGSVGPEASGGDSGLQRYLSQHAIKKQQKFSQQQFPATFQNMQSDASGNAGFQNQPLPSPATIFTIWSQNGQASGDSAANFSPAATFATLSQMQVTQQYPSMDGRSPMAVNQRSHLAQQASMPGPDESSGMNADSQPGSMQLNSAFAGPFSVNFGQMDGSGQSGPNTNALPNSGFVSPSLNSNLPVPASQQLFPGLQNSNIQIAGFQDPQAQSPSMTQSPQLPNYLFQSPHGSIHGGHNVNPFHITTPMKQSRNRKFDHIEDMSLLAACFFFIFECPNKTMSWPTIEESLHLINADFSRDIPKIANRFNKYLKKEYLFDFHRVTAGDIEVFFSWAIANNCSVNFEVSTNAWNESRDACYKRIHYYIVCIYLKRTFGQAAGNNFSNLPPNSINDMLMSLIEWWSKGATLCIEVGL